MAQTVVIDVVARFIDQTSKNLERAKKTVDKFGESIDKTRKQAEKIGKTKANIHLNVKDKATQIIQKTGKSLKGLTSKVWKITMKAVDKATAPIRGIFNFLKKPLVIGASILGLTLGAKDVISTYATFEATMSKVGAISGATAGEMQVLTEKAKQMGATTKFTASEAGEAFTYMAMAGWKTKEMLGGIEGVMNLAAASGEELGTVSDIVTDAMTAFGLAADGTTKIIGPNGLSKEVANATHFADVLAAASSNSNTNVAMLGESFKYCAPLAGQYKFSIEDTALALGLMANSGIKASNSGTAMRRILTQLSSDFEVLQADGSKFVVTTANADGSMRSLKEILDDTRTAFNGMSDAEKAAMGQDMTNTAKGLGIALENENGELKTQAELYSDVIEATQTMTDAGKVAEAEALAGKTAMAGLLSIVGASDKDYKKLSDAVYHADGAAAEMAARMMDNLEGDMILFQSAAESAKIAFMGKLAPSLRSFVRWITSKMPDISKTLEGVADSISEKIKGVQETIQEFTSSGDWQNADLFGKIGIAWNKIIAEPFAEWWGSTGKAWAADVACKIGNGIGSGISAGILALLGVDVSGIAEDGHSIGASFAEGFMAGFDGSKVWEAIQEKIGQMFSSALKILPGGEEATAGSWLSAALIGYAGLKVGKGVYGAGKGIMSTGSILTGSQITGASILGSAASGTGLLGLGSNTAIALGAGNLAGGASLSVGALSAIGLSSILGGAVGLAGVGSGLKDFKEGETERGVAKVGMVGAGAGIGAGIGTFIFPGIGTAAGALIGAGVGGLGAILEGNNLGDWIHETFTEEGRREKERREAAEKKAAEEAAERAEKEEIIRKEKEKQLAIEKRISELKDTRLELKSINDRMFETNKLKESWIALHNELESGLLTEEERINKQNELNGIVQELANLYPDIIDANDTENGQLDEKIEKIQEMNDLEKERQRLLLENQLIEAEKNLETLSGDLGKSNEKVGVLQGMEEKFNGDNQLNLSTQIAKLENFEQELANAVSRHEGKSVIEAYEKLIEGQKREIDKALQAMGVTNPLNMAFDMFGIDAPNLDGMFRFSYDRESINTEVMNMKKLVNDELIAEIENNQKLKDQVNEIYEAQVKMLELELGKPIDEAAKSYDTMSEAQKAAFDKAVKGISDLNLKFKGLVDQPKYVDIILKFDPRGAHLLGLLDDNPTIEKKSKPERYHASGGILTKPHIGMVAEAGAEAIIPLSGTNKHRGISLWEKTGQLLGLLPQNGIGIRHASGGIFGTGKTATPQCFLQASSQSNDARSVGTTSVTISLGGMNFTFNGGGTTDKDGMMQMIRQQMPEIADEVAQTIAEALQRIFPNLKTGYF